MTAAQAAKKKMGRPNIGYPRNYTVKLFTGDAEWAKQQPLGLSGLCRLLLSWERWLREAPEGSVSLADAKTLALRGVTAGLTPDEVRDLCGMVLRIAEEVCDG